MELLHHLGGQTAINLAEPLEEPEVSRLSVQTVQLLKRQKIESAFEKIACKACYSSA